MTTQLDLIIRAGSVVTPDGIQQLDIGVENEQIVLLAKTISAPAKNEILAEGMFILPGIIDAHVHFNEPGRTDWEGLATGSSALAAGGGTMFFDMPLNSDPPVLDAETFQLKRELAEKKSVLDFALWGGLVPENLERLEGLRDAGAIGLKAFMCGSGIDEFPGVTEYKTLSRGMKRAAELGMLVAVHAEDEKLAHEYAKKAKESGEIDARAWLRSRPTEVEVKAIETALEIAGETGCALHIVHVSSVEGVEIITAAKHRGVNVTAETCPHYLLLNELDVIRLGACAKCAPPLRSELNREGLWTKMRQGEIDTIGSDHSPAPPEMKRSSDFFSIWGGISGCQHGFQLLIGRSVEKDHENRLVGLSGLLAANVSRRFRLGSSKGSIAVGADADFAIWDFRESQILNNVDLLYRHRQGPYDGQKTRARVVRTFSRGRPIYSGVRTPNERNDAKFIRPQV